VNREKRETYLREPESDLLESVLNGVRSVADVSSHVYRGGGQREKGKR